MRRERSTHSLSGDGWYEENTQLFGIITYKRVRRQKWSPTLHEIEVECGVRFGRFRIGLTSSKLHWRDNWTIQKRRYGL